MINFNINILTMVKNIHPIEPNRGYPYAEVSKAIKECLKENDDEFAIWNCYTNYLLGMGKKNFISHCKSKLEEAKLDESGLMSYTNNFPEYLHPNKITFRKNKRYTHEYKIYTCEYNENDVCVFKIQFDKFMNARILYVYSDGIINYVLTMRGNKVFGIAHNNRIKLY
jgi:hypothetical protein